MEHHYGPHVHLFQDPFLLTLLARISAPETGTEQLPALVRSAYQRLAFTTLSREFPVVQGRVKTRMAATEPKGFYEGPVFCKETNPVRTSGSLRPNCWSAVPPCRLHLGRCTARRSAHVPAPGAYQGPMPALVPWRDLDPDVPCRA